MHLLVFQSELAVVLYATITIVWQNANNLNDFVSGINFPAFPFLSRKKPIIIRSG